MKKVAMKSLQADLPRYLKKAEKDRLLIMNDGKAVGVLIGIPAGDDWMDHVIENHPALIQRTSRARQDLREGRGIRLEDVDV